MHTGRQIKIAALKALRAKLDGTAATMPVWLNWAEHLQNYSYVHLNRESYFN